MKKMNVLQSNLDQIDEESPSENSIRLIFGISNDIFQSMNAAEKQMQIDKYSKELNQDKTLLD